MPKIKTYTKVEKNNRQEYGYGQYVNAYVVDNDLNDNAEMGLWASECMSFDATSDQISRSRRRVRQNARNAYQRDLDSI